MKIIDKNLYLEFADAISCGLGSQEYLWNAKSAGIRTFSFIKDPEDNRKVLIEYESLKPKHKKLVEDHFGNPYDYFVKEPIKKMIVRDDAAQKFFLKYQYNNKTLGDEAIEKYTISASWLNMLVKISRDKDAKKDIKKQLNISLSEFYIKIGELIKSEKIDLPQSLRRLLPKVAEYQNQGYSCLIHKNFSNTHANKVSTEEAEARLLEMINHHNQFDDVFVCYNYNKWAKENDLPEISAGTVRNYRIKNIQEITIGREGNGAFNEKFIRQVKGYRPTQPLYLVEHDDNNLDLLYQSEDKYQFNKYVAIVVIDSSCDYVLGKSYMLGRHIEKGFGDLLVRSAYLDAMYNIKRLTGGWYLPFEIKSDKYASKSLTPFYNKIGKCIPPAHGNKHRGYIEQFFRLPLWKRAQKLLGETNWSGNNMTAKFRGMNPDALDLSIKEKSRPFVGVEAEQQIENFFFMLRNMPDIKREEMNAESKEQQWLRAWQKLTPEQKRPITDEQFLLTFGIKHNPQGRTIMITSRGIEPEIQGTKYSYDLPEAWMYEKLIGEQITVIFDPYDMSRILVTNEKNIRFIATSAQLVARSLEDMRYNPTRIFLDSILAGKKLQVRNVMNKKERRREFAQNVFEAEAMLQGNVLVKELKNGAEQKMLEQFTNERESWMDNNNDFSEFFS